MDTIDYAIENINIVSSFNFKVGTLDDDQTDRLADALEMNSNVTLIDVSYNRIGANGMYALSQALKINTTITSIRLQGNAFGNSGIKYLSDALKVNSTLTSISIGYHGIHSDGILPFSKAIRNNTSIQSIEIHGDINWTSVLESFKISTSMQTVYMSGCRMNSESMAVWSQVVKCNSTITSITLSDSTIAESELIPLFDALKINTSIKRLDFYTKNIGDAGLVALAEALTTNVCIRSVCMQNSTINAKSSSFGITTLAGALQLNSCITLMHFWGIPYDDGSALTLKRAVKHNVVQASSLFFDRFMHESCMDVDLYNT